MDHDTQLETRADGGRRPAPCTTGCPAGIDVPRYIGYAALGKFGEAAAVVRERIPFPAICGYVCYRPCEAECRRAYWEAPVAINAIKRAAMERDTSVWRTRWGSSIAPASGKRVAVVGSGPAGLTAAYYLGKRCGHEVTVFEAQAKPGGQLRIGIPANRLPRETLDREIGVICENRVQIRCSQRVEDLDGLLRDGYHAVLVAVGTCVARSLELPGEELPGVCSAVQFLKEANLGIEQGRLAPIGRRVAVIGGGNVAVDCARTALRSGAEEVRMLYRRERAQMPAYEFEVRAAEAEGVKVELLLAPVRIERDGGALRLWLQRMELGRADRSGRAAPQPVPGSEHALAVDAVMVAIGQTPGVLDAWGLPVRKDGTLQLRTGALKTARDGVFAAGDAVLGAASVIEAIAQGRAAAQEIDRYLGGSGQIGEALAPEPREEMHYPADIHPHGKGCVAMAELPAASRARGFEVVERGYSDAEVKDEALRCVRCDLWSAKGAPEVWWRRRGLSPYWLGGDDRRGRERDRKRVQHAGPYAPTYEHAPYIAHEYAAKE